MATKRIPYGVSDFQRFSCFFCTLALLYTFTNEGDTGDKKYEDGTIKASTTMYWPS